MTLIEKVEKKYGSLKEEWVTEKGKVHEIRMIRELAIELKKAQDELTRANYRIDEIWRDKRNSTVKLERILELYKKRTYLVMDHIEHMRDTIDKHVDDVEDVLAQHTILQEQLEEENE